MDRRVSKFGNQGKLKEQQTFLTIVHSGGIDGETIINPPYGPETPKSKFR